MPISTHEAFLTGLLPPLVARHFQAISRLAAIHQGASGALREQIQRRSAALTRGGPELVSRVVSLENLLIARGERPPAPPRTPADLPPWAAAIDGAAGRLTAGDPGLARSRALGQAAGGALLALADRELLSSLARVAPEHGGLQADLEVSRRALSGGVARYEEIATPAGGEAAALATALRAAAAGQEDHSRIVLLSLVRAFRSERPPRELIAAAQAGTLTRDALARGLVEHRRWASPAAPGKDGQPGLTLFTVDGYSRFFAFSDDEAVARFGTAELAGLVRGTGAALFGAIPEAASAAVIDGGLERSALFDRIQLPGLRSLAAEVALEETLDDWISLDEPALLGFERYWVLRAGDQIRTLVAVDPAGRRQAAVFSSKDSLERFADANRSPEIAHGTPSWMSGADLFSHLLTAGTGAAFNPLGPGPTRWLNADFIRQLVS
jgi:hypothetical protein